MKLLEINKYLKIYQFYPDINSNITINITVLISNNSALIIDSGYYENTQTVINELKKQNITIEKVLLTHFHNDHIGGIPLIKEVIGNKYAEDTLKLYVKDYQKYLPTIKINTNQTIYFNEHKLDLRLNDGHSKDGLLILLNDKYLFVGDDLIYDNLANSSLPYPTTDSIDNQINSLLIIKNISKSKIIIPAHGKIVEDYDYLVKDINNRIKYLNYLKDNKTYEDFLKDTSISFIPRQWHKVVKI